MHRTRSSKPHGHEQRNGCQHRLTQREDDPDEDFKISGSVNSCRFDQAFGIVPIYVRITIILNALIIDGITYTQNEFSRCKSFIRKYPGIKPALKYIVRIKINVIGLRNTYSRRLSVYASIVVKTRFSNVESTVRATEIQNASYIVPEANTAL